MAATESAEGHAFFISHGTGPMPLIGGPHEQSFLSTLRKNAHILDGAKALIIFSAHWETANPTITGSAKPGVYYDYEEMRSQLPPATFEFQYNAPGYPELAQEISEVLVKEGWEVKIDTQRGFDHAIYVPMTIMRPQADIPIVQMAILTGSNEQEATDKNIALGRAMQTFVDQGYMVIGSGNTYHDFRAIAGAYFSPEPGAKIPAGSTLFEDWVEEAAGIEDPEERCKRLGMWRQDERSWKAHPEGCAEHFYPFLVAASAGGGRIGRKVDTCETVGSPMPLYLW